jgi:hypothetical protein
MPYMWRYAITILAVLSPDLAAKKKWSMACSSSA